MKIHKFKPKKKKDTLLYKLLFLVLGLHAAGLLIFGGMIISETYLSADEAFEAPPPAEPIEPVKLPPPPPQQATNQQQQDSAASQMIKRIQVPQTKMTNVSLAQINLPSSDVAGGTSISGGMAPKGIGNVNISMENVSLMGLGGKTEKIVILLDTSRYMMTDARGALDTYNVIKKDIKTLVEKLPPTILFNVIAYAVPDKGDVKINAFSSAGLVSASQDNKAKLMAWLDPINANLKSLEVKNNYKLKLPFMPQAAGGDKTGYDPDDGRMYKAYHAAMEQGADTIYILTARWIPPSTVKKPWTDAQKAEYEKREKAAKADYAKKLAAHKSKMAVKNEVKKDNKQAAAEAEAARKATMSESQKEAEAAKKAAATAQAKAAAQAKAKAIANAKAANKQAEADLKARAQNWIKTTNEARAKKKESLYTGTWQQVVKEQKWSAQTKNVPKARHGGGGTPPPKYNPPTVKANDGYTAAEMAKYYVKKLNEKNKGISYKTPTINMIIFKGKGEKIDGISGVAEKFCAGHNNGKIRVLEGLKAMGK